MVKGCPASTELISVTSDLVHIQRLLAPPRNNHEQWSWEKESRYVETCPFCWRMTAGSQVSSRYGKYLNTSYQT